MFADIYRGKKVFVTGHTGFKGAWLSEWLLKLGARVVGYSKDIPTTPSLFEVLSLEERLAHNLGDIRDLDKLINIVESEKPDFVFHMAAQAIVSASYSEPIETISTNVIGTANVLEALRYVKHKCAVVMVTSDKCYENVEWLWGYKETDKLGGKDIYSSSKSSAELIIHSYQQSFYKDNELVRIATGRAGNVIGGGDWARDRIIVDTVKAWSDGQPVKIRCPDSTRPWQHVLEPLSGYLCLGHSLWISNVANHQAFNFGPTTQESHKVVDLLDKMYSEWFDDRQNSAEPFIFTDNIPFNEAGLLKLNCDKARYFLDWTSSLNYQQTVEMIVDWYKAFYTQNKDIRLLTNDQILFYERQYKSE